MESRFFSRVHGSTPVRTDDSACACILDGLGGRANLLGLSCCATRLRAEVADPALVSDLLLQSCGASGVLHRGCSIQVIYGAQVTDVLRALEAYLAQHTADPQTSRPVLAPSERPAAQKTVLVSPLNGTVIALDDVEDEAFSMHVLGDGIAIEPEDGSLFSPCNGRIETVCGAGHAISLLADSGAAVLIHIGIDTVNLGGRFFRVHVKEGQPIRQGELLISFDADAIRRAGYPVTTPIIISNTDDYTAVTPAAQGRIAAGDRLLTVI